MPLSPEQIAFIGTELSDAATADSTDNLLYTTAYTDGFITTAQFISDLSNEAAYDADYNAYLLSQLAGTTPFNPITYGSPLCYLRGTHILTDNGEVLIEDLKAGDIAVTVSGAAFPVRWIGYREFDLARHPAPERVQPIRIQRGAFADNVPHRDLLVSPDHAIFVDDKLICARQLVNETTIRMETGLNTIEYFHVELASHAILLAEGLPAESYLNTGNKGFFVNSGQPLVLHPDLTKDSDHPTRERASCAPFVWQEDSVRPVWERLADRAATLGQPVVSVDTASDPDLYVVAKGQTLRPVRSGDGLYQFVVPTGTSEIRVVSRAAAPSDIRPWMEDRRRLGVYAERIVMYGAHEVKEVPIDHPGLSQGWWAVEREGGELRRWTDGDAVVPLPIADGPVLLEIRATSSGMKYPMAAQQQRSAA